MSDSLHDLARQRGAATLLVVLVLLIAMAMLAVTTMRSGMVEQQITGNDMRAREAFEGGDAGIEYGLAYLTNNSTYSNYKALSWTTSGGIETSQPVASDNITSGVFSYVPNVTYQRVPNSDYIRIVSSATETHDNTISATNEQYVKVQAILNGGGAFNAPPVAMNGCLTDVTGSPDVYVGTRPDGIAAGTSQAPANQGVWGDGSDADNPCLKQGENHLNAHGGQPAGSLFSTADGKTAWEYVFGSYTRAQIKAKADAEVAAGVAADDRNYIWVTDSANYHTSWGTASHPVILVFDAVSDCPAINGSPIIYGIVFIDSPCTANGWGGATVYGSVIVNGNISKLNSNTTIYDWSDPDTGSTSKLGNNFIDGIYKIPGTWKDFQ